MFSALVGAQTFDGPLASYYACVVLGVLGVLDLQLDPEATPQPFSLSLIICTD